MAKLLYIESSPRKSRSKSIEVAKVFLDTYRNTHPDDEIATIDLWTRTLPEIDGDALDARYQIARGNAGTDAQQLAWQSVVDICNEFKSADKFLFGVPMWNFGIPYKLKHYIDVIAQPGQTFSFDPDTGYTGLVTGKPAIAIYARGGAYGGEAGSMDMQTTYLNLVLKFLGFTDVTDLIIEPTMGEPDDVAATLASVKSQATAKATHF